MTSISIVHLSMCRRSPCLSIDYAASMATTRFSRRDRKGTYNREPHCILCDYPSASQPTVTFQPDRDDISQHELRVFFGTRRESRSDSEASRTATKSNGRSRGSAAELVAAANATTHRVLLSGETRRRR